MKFINALSSFAPLPLKTENLEPEIFTALSKSNMSKSTPKSQCALTSKSNFLGSKNFLISTLSSSLFPIGISLFGVFGILKSSFLISSSKSFTFTSSSLISSESNFISLNSSETSTPSFFNFGTCFETSFCLAFLFSTSKIISLLFSSSSITLSRL